MAAGEDVAFAAETADAFHDAGVAAEDLRFSELEFGFGGTVLQKFLQFFIGFFFDNGEIAAGLGSQFERKLAGNFVVVVFGGGAGGDLILVDEALVETRSFSLAENARGEIEQGFVGRAVLGNVPDAIGAGLRDIVLNGAAMRAGALGDPNFLASDGRNGGNGAVIFFYLLARDFGSDVAGKDERDVVGAVITFEPVLDVGERGGVEIFHGADDGPGIGMAGGIGVFGDELLGHAVGLVFTLALFVLDHSALQIDGLLIERSEQMAHAVGLPAIACNRARRWGRPRNSWCGRYWWCRSCRWRRCAPWH